MIVDTCNLKTNVFALRLRSGVVGLNSSQCVCVYVHTGCVCGILLVWYSSMDPGLLFLPDALNKASIPLCSSIPAACMWIRKWTTLRLQLLSNAFIVWHNKLMIKFVALIEFYWFYLFINAALIMQEKCLTYLVCYEWHFFFLLFCRSVKMLSILLRDCCIQGRWTLRKGHRPTQ